MAASALSAVLGFGREIVTAHYFGTRPEMDAFLNASIIPIILFGVFNGALVAALVPTFSDYVSQGRQDEVRRLGSTIINALLIVMTVLAACGWLFAPIFAPVVAHGFPASEQDLVVNIVRWLMPGIVALSLSGVCAAILNANHRFMASALIWVAANIVTIAILITLHRQLGIFALALGSVAGLFAQLVVQVPSLLRQKLYSFEIDWRHPGLAKMWALLVPVAIGSSAGQVNIGFDRYFASNLSAGSTAALGYTTKLVFLPILVVAAAIATVIFPLIAGQFANADRAAIRHSIARALRMVGFVVIPCAAGVSALAYPIVQTLFERGAFGPSATSLCASLVPYACVPLLAVSYITVLGRACYACKEVKMAVGGSICAVAINIALSAVWSQAFGARGLLLANGVSEFLLAVFEVALLWRLIGGMEWRPLASSIVRISVASLVMAGVLYAVNSLWVFAAGTMVYRALHLAVLLTIGLFTFIAAAKVLRVDELSMAANTIMQKLSRAKGAGATSRSGAPEAS